MFQIRFVVLGVVAIAALVNKPSNLNVKEIVREGQEPGIRTVIASVASRLDLSTSFISMTPRTKFWGDTATYSASSASFDRMAFPSGGERGHHQPLRRHAALEHLFDTTQSLGVKDDGVDKEVVPTTIPPPTDEDRARCDRMVTRTEGFGIGAKEAHADRVKNCLTIERFPPCVEAR